MADRALVVYPGLCASGNASPLKDATPYTACTLAHIGSKYHLSHMNKFLNITLKDSFFKAEYYLIGIYFILLTLISAFKQTIPLKILIDFISVAFLIIIFVSYILLAKKIVYKILLTISLLIIAGISFKILQLPGAGLMLGFGLFSQIIFPFVWIIEIINDKNNYFSLKVKGLLILLSILLLSQRIFSFMLLDWNIYNFIFYSNFLIALIGIYIIDIINGLTDFIYTIKIVTIISITIIIINSFN
jgi:hypothetical protein